MNAISPELTRLITNYRNASRTLLIACRAADVPNPAPRPQVQYGYMLKAGDEREPLYAHSIDHLNELEAQQISINSMWTGEPAERMNVKTRARFDGLRIDLKQQIQAQKQIEQDSGYSELQAKADQAFDAEQKATDALLSYQPQTVTEVAATAQIMLARLKEGCFCEVEIKRLLRALSRTRMVAKSAA